MTINESTRRTIGLLATILALAIAGTPALAERAVDESCQVQGVVRVTVESLSGDIVVAGGAAGVVSVQGRIGDEAWTAGQNPGHHHAQRVVRHGLAHSLSTIVEDLHESQAWVGGQLS